jgi:hypothetical protein
MSNQFQDVHKFDGLWSHNLKNSISKDRKLESFQTLIQMIQDLKLEDRSIEGLKLITQNCEEPSNYDHINKIYADDILIEFYNLLLYLTLENQKTFLYILAEQMNDLINLGTCPMGRTTRIWQLYRALNESLREQITINLHPEFVGETVEIKYKILVT